MYTNPAFFLETISIAQRVPDGRHQIITVIKRSLREPLTLHYMKHRRCDVEEHNTICLHHHPQPACKTCQWIGSERSQLQCETSTNIEMYFISHSTQNCRTFHIFNKTHFRPLPMSKHCVKSSGTHMKSDGIRSVHPETRCESYTWSTDARYKRDPRD